MKFAAACVLWLAAALMAAAAPAPTHPEWKICRNPVRVFPGQANVDLAPLFDWWNRQPLVPATNADEAASALTDRPLTAWRRVTGAKAGAVGASWVVNAVIYTSPTVRTNARIILNHPPAVEEQLYATLKAQLAQAQQEIAGARRTYESNTNAELRALVRAEVYRRSLTKVASDGAIAYSQLAATKHNAAAAALTQLDQLEAARAEIEKRLKAIPAMNGAYRIDWFAVELGKTRKGVPIYDLGLVSPNPP